MNQLKILSLFSGIGAFEKALKRLEINYEIINWCEIDKFASKVYSAIHNISEDLNLGNIKEIDEKTLPDFDLMTWAAPCVDISVCGNQGGFSPQSNTRSSVLWETLKIIDYKKPKYMVMENVKNLVGKKFKKDFDSLLKILDKMGYNNYWTILNAKDFNIPQNRERVFLINIRKDIDDGKFIFPEGIDGSVKLRDLLENEVDEKYYINIDKVKNLIEQLKDKEISNSIRVGGRGSIDRHQWDLIAEKEILNNYKESIIDDTQGFDGVRCYKDLTPTLRSNRQGLKILEVRPCLTPERINKRQIRRVYSENGLSPTLNTMQGGNRQPKVLIIKEDENYYLISIRRLTPLECWRLMDFDDNDYYNAKQILEESFYNGKNKSDSQMYKMAGNSIVVKVLEEIFKNLFKIK